MSPNTTDRPQGESPLKIACRTCGASPIDGVALFADGHDDTGLRRFCPEHLPLSAVRRRMEREDARQIDPGVLAVFTRRLAAKS
jgi:hypothetical protein